MRRAVTAIYPTYATASLVRDDLERLGIGRHNITVIPDADRGTASVGSGTAGRAQTAFATTGGAFVVTTLDQPDTTSSFSGVDAGYEDAFDRLHGLDLQEEDTRVYQRAMRNGDYVVSVQVDDDADLSRIQEVMRQPESLQTRRLGIRSPVYAKHARDDGRTEDDD